MASAKILNDCRDLAIHRLVLSFSSMLDRVSDLLMTRAERSDVREDQVLFLDSRGTLNSERGNLMGAFERHLREMVDRRMSGDDTFKANFASVDVRNLTLVDTSAMDESVVLSNIVRVVENLCAEELQEFNRSVGYLLGRPELETAGNPLAPMTIVHAFTEALRGIKGDSRVKVTILKELNQASLGDINAIYADLNKHLANMHVVPPMRRSMIQRSLYPGTTGTPRERDVRSEVPEPPSAAQPQQETDLMAMLQRLANAGIGIGRMQPAFKPATGEGGLPMVDLGAAKLGPFGGPRILMTQEVGNALSRLQQGETGFEFDGIPIEFTGVPQDMHNVLRDLQDSPIGAKANQLEAMTIELVAMLFDFIFETKDLPDSMKVLIGRLQIPVLKAAMLDGAFFSKKTHPSRLFVNALAHAGIGWSPAMGVEDPLYRKIDALVHRVLNEFTDDIFLFDELRKDLEDFLAEEEKNAEVNIQSSADEIDRRDREELARVVSHAEVERRIESVTVPNFLASFLRDKWMATLAQVHSRDGEEGEAWLATLTTLDDLVWSVQPKRSTEERRKLIAMLPSLLKRLHTGLQGATWETGEREQFMANLVEAHAAAVKPSLASSAKMPTTAVAEAAAVAADEASAKGDVEVAAKARALAEAMAPAPPPPPPEPAVEVLRDHYAEIAATLERGMWIEFEGDDGQLAFAKLAWVSPLRGTYLFTNRQGQKAVSLTADELAARFRNDRARLVEAEPLIDRAFVKMISSLGEKLNERTPAS